MELVVLLAVTMGVIGLAGRLPDARRVKRDLASARLHSITSLPDGKIVAVHGIVKVLDAATVVAPLTGRVCVYWLVTFDELGVAGDFRELGRSERGCPFLLSAQGTTARVVPGTPRLSLPGESRIRPASHLLDRIHNDPALELARAVCRPANYPRTSALRMTEYVVTEAMEVTIKGWCTRESDPDAAEAVSGDYRGELPTRAVISGSRRAPLLIG